MGTYVVFVGLMKSIGWLNVFIEGDSTAPLHSGSIVLCTVSSKLIATVLTYPHEVVRTRLQIVQPPIVEDLPSDGTIKAQKKRNIVYITRKIIRKEGWTGLYKGLSVNLFRSVFYSTVTVLSCVLSDLDIIVDASVWLTQV